MRTDPEINASGFQAEPSLPWNQLGLGLYPDRIRAIRGKIPLLGSRSSAALAVNQSA
jgi:hypothetical protein